MNTDELIAEMSRHPRTTALPPTATIVGGAMTATAVVLTLSILWLKPRVDFDLLLPAHNQVFLLKLIFTVCVVVAVLPIVRDLSVPGRKIGLWSILVMGPFAFMSVLALIELTHLPVSHWSHHLSDGSFWECLWQIPALAVPAYVILAVCARQLAPTNLTRTGAYLGLAAGGIGAVGYALHCHDDSVVFVAMFYTLAILETTVVGALLGPRVLRWTAARR